MAEPIYRLFYLLSDLPEEIAARITIHPQTGCWLYGRGAMYVSIERNGKKEAVHRVVYKLLVGPIPDGWQVDHVYASGCRFERCCWPVHLEAVTPAENTRRAVAAKRSREGLPLRFRALT